MNQRHLLWALLVVVAGCRPRPTADLNEVHSPRVATVHAPETEDADEDDGPKARWTDLDIESEFGCALERTGSVYCWGRGPAAEMGIRELPEQPTADPYDWNSQRKWGPPSRIEPIHDATALSTANNRGCAIVEDGRVRCWGAVGWSGQQLFDVAGIDGARELEVGTGESCAILDDASLWCWSTTDFGVARARLDNAVAMTVRDNLGCGLTAQGDVVCWGSSVADWHRYSQQMNQPVAPGAPPTQPDERDYPDVVEIGRFRGAVDVAISGWNNLCLTMKNGTLRCSNADMFSVLRGDSLDLRDVSGVDGVREMASSNNHRCAVGQGGSLHCWGRNVYGQVGDGTALQRDEPTLVEVPPVNHVSLTEDMSCAATADDSIYCWGFDRGEAIDRELKHFHTIEGVRATSMVTHGRTTCVVDQNKQLRCWGADSVETVGIELVANPLTIDVDIGGKLGGFTSGWEPCFLGGNGKLHCGNWNSYALVTKPPGAPLTNVTTLDDVVEVANGNPPVCAIAKQGRKTELRCGANAKALEPERKFKSPTALSATNGRACVVHSGGKVGCFGELYQWGDNPPLARQITTITGVSKARGIVSANSQDCALLASGRVSCWPGRTQTDWDERNRRPTAIRYEPQTAEDVGLSGVTKLSGRSSTLCAIVQGGEVKCWRDNIYSETIEWIETPSQLGKDIVDIGVGYDSVCAMHKDGRVSCWGEDVYGQLGRVPTRVYLAPTKLPVE